LWAETEFDEHAFEFGFDASLSVVGVGGGGLGEPVADEVDAGQGVYEGGDEGATFDEVYGPGIYVATGLTDEAAELFDFSAEGCRWGHAGFLSGVVLWR
jgi:hypothetical protein